MTLLKRSLRGRQSQRVTSQMLHGCISLQSAASHGVPLVFVCPAKW